MNRTDIINRLIRKSRYDTYLEIGVNNPRVNYDKINCKHKTGVDPSPKSDKIIGKTSDEFFKDNTEKFDIVFIDGLHHAEQVYKDIVNALSVLNEGGVIVCHDMNPEKEEIQKVPRETNEWTGDCWKAWIKLRRERFELEMFVIDTDYGVGVIREGYQDELKIKLKGEPDYKWLDDNRKEALNLISVEEFIESEPEIMFYELTPYSLDGDLGAACNKCCEIVPDDNDWILISDQDSMILTPEYGHLISSYIEKYPDVDLFTCRTNRVNNKLQLEPGMFDATDIPTHRRKAVELSKKPLSLTYTTRVISGYFMLFQKKTWTKYKFRENRFYGVDTYFSRDVLRDGKIGIMDNIYSMHYYRMIEGVGKKYKL